LTEEFARAAKSVVHSDVEGQVAKSPHAGIPWLRSIRERLGERIHFWPFDNWDIPTDLSPLHRTVAQVEGWILEVSGNGGAAKAFLKRKKGMSPKFSRSPRNTTQPGDTNIRDVTMRINGDF
jgi:hypothetical protein